MPFLRPGHDGTFASPFAYSALIAPTISSQSSCKAPLRARRVSQFLTLFSLSAASLASSANAKPFKAVGVKAWTSGSQTFIRARPSADVPPVAKVGRHTPLYVWGKYNGWYRVETHDHKFGWVYNRYIETPKAYKVRAMPESKARLASNRTAEQKVYGSPQLLKKYFAAYGAPSARKNATKSGIRLASKPKVLLAKAEFKTAQKQNLASVTAPRSASASRPRVASPSTSRVVTSRVAKRAISPVPRIEAVRVAQAAKPARKSPTSKPAVKIASAKIELRSATRFSATKNEVPTRVFAPALGEKMSGYAAPRVESFGRIQTLAPVVKPDIQSATRAVESQKIARSSRALTPSAKYFARAASEAALMSEPVSTSEESVAGAPVLVAPPVAIIAPVAPRPKARVSRVRRAAKTAAKKALAKSNSKKRYATRKERQRQQLRARMGLVKSAPHSVIAPVSPDELMKARQEYLNSRNARFGLPASPSAASPAAEAPLSSVTGISPLPAPTTPLGGPSSTGLAPLAPAQFAPMSFDSSHPLAPLLGNPYVISLAQLKSKPVVVVLPKSIASKAVANKAVLGKAGLVAVTAIAPLSNRVSSRGGSPRDRALSRGGSPRDRFGAGMASQALSYRGMRYVRGAASPRRGFDCSGLVYFLLKQRGYNPPRMASGYRSWGQSVPKNQLKSGDLVLFANTYKRGISHIGVYMGEGKFVHAATSSTGVRVSSLNEKYYAGKYFGARRAK